jgi:hypothetical protein
MLKVGVPGNQFIIFKFNAGSPKSLIWDFLKGLLKWKIPKTTPPLPAGDKMNSGDCYRYMRGSWIINS